MDYSVISSRNNDRIKYVKKLVTDASLRRESGLFTLEGARLCADAVRSGYEVKETYITQNALEKYRDTVTPLLENSGEDPHTVANALAAELKADVVAVTGKKAVLYRRSSKKPVIELP